MRSSKRAPAFVTHACSVSGSALRTTLRASSSSVCSLFSSCNRDSALRKAVHGSDRFLLSSKFIGSRLVLGSSSALKNRSFHVTRCQAAAPSSPSAVVERVPATTPERIELPSNESSDNLLRIRHTSAHVMAMAVQKLFPKAQVTIGPWIENGFYYDFDCPEPFTDADLKSIKKEMQKIIRRNLPITREEVTREEARARIEKIGEKYKLEILEGIKGDDITIYHVGTEWWDLCAGPHVESTGKIPDKAVDLEAVAGAYWRGDEKNAMLQRIYGTAWETPEQLKTYQKMREEAKKRDHRKLGQELGLFSIQQESAGGGLVFWHPNGSIMRHLIEAYWKQVHLDSGYELLYTPHMANVNLWKISGHLDFYRENMFNTMDIDEQRYQIKPMNCPCHCLIFKDTLHSYRELPKRWAELGTVYRYERSGVLHGLFRVRGFTQDDAHIFCLPDQIAPEIKGVLDLTERILREFGFTKFEVNLSTRPEKSVGSDDIWERATAALKEALAAKGWDYIEDIGGGAFYGPKIDIKIEDAIGRKWQCSTIQCDFNLPERFDLEYIASDGSRQRPIMLHRAIFGSLERFFGILVENYAGDFPLWLAPVQARILPVSEVQYEYADRAAEQLRAAGLRVEVDKSNERLGKMVRNSEKLKIPIMIIVGKSETETDTVNVRIRIKREEGEADDKEGDLGCMPVGDLVTFAQAAVASRLPVAEYFRQSKQI